MNNELDIALTSFSNEVTSHFDLTVIMGILGKAVAISVLIFLGVWGALKILNYMLGFAFEHLSPEKQEKVAEWAYKKLYVHKRFRKWF